MNIRKLIVKESRSWIGTKFHHQGRVRKSLTSLGGCDCLGLVIETAKTLDLKDKYGNKIANLDEANYPIIPSGDYLYKKLAQHFKEKNLTNIAPGDIALFRFVKNPQHLAIIGEQRYDEHTHCTLIHSYSVSGFVCEHILNRKWQERLVAIFSII
jgi:cell wall-associated NlpC family hydrolase